MIVLDTSTTLSVSLGSAKASNNPEFQASYIDTADNSPGVSRGSTAGTSDVSLVAAPSEGSRLVRQFSLFNADSVAVQATVKLITVSVARRIVTQEIGVGETLHYNSERGFELSAGNASGLSLTSMEEISFGAEHDNGTKSADAEIDWSKGNNQKVTLGADVTLTFANFGVGHKQLKVAQDETGGRTPTLPAGLWPGGEEGAFSTAANSVDILSVYYDGSSYFYQLSKGWA